MYCTTWQRRLRGAAVFAAFLTAACADPPIGPRPTPDAMGITANLVNKPPLDITLEGEAWVCEDGAEPAGNFTFAVSVDGGPATNHSIARGTCVMVHSVSRVGSTRASVSVTESVPAGWTLNSITIESNYQTRPDLYEPAINSPNASGTIRNDVGVVFTFENATVPNAGGRMTGGGMQLFGSIKVSRGFTIHCDIILSNNLEINWTGGNNWHIDKPLTKATCFDDPAYDETPPVAPFNTFVGEGIGRLNGVDGSKVFFTFIDAGEPGKNDKAAIKIIAPDGVTVVLDVPLSLLDHGNIQAHYDQPHGQKPPK